jgi:acetyl esterase
VPLGPQEQQLTDMLAAAAPAEPRPLEAETMRQAYSGLAAMLPPGPEVDVVDRTVPGPAGEIPVRVYRPSGAEGPLGVLVYLHGGGWTIGGLDTHDHPCRTLCAEAGIVVVSVDYRLAPEHPFPAALDDSWAVLEWVAANAAEVGGDPARLAVGGDSGGGNLAAVMSILARDRGGPALRFQLLVYPAVDLRPDAPERFRSRIENGEGYVLTSQAMEFFAANYAPDPEQRSDWRISPLLAADHSGLPPALVITAEFDPLRDEGRAYADLLEAAGTPVTHTLYEGTVHTMYQLAPFLDAGKAALAESAAALRDAIG